MSPDKRDYFIKADFLTTYKIAKLTKLPVEDVGTLLMYHYRNKTPVAVTRGDKIVELEGVFRDRRNHAQKYINRLRVRPEFLPTILAQLQNPNLSPLNTMVQTTENGGCSNEI